MGEDIPAIQDIHRAFEGIIDITSTAAGSSSPLNNGDTWVFTITVSNNAGAPILTELDVSLYQNTASTNYRLLGGALTDGSQWQIMGPWADWGASTGVGTTASIDSVFKVYIRNISAGAAQTVLIKVVARTIANTFTKGSSPS